MSTAAQSYEKYYFKGKLNNKIPVEIAWYTTLNDGDWVTMGYIYYPNAKNPAPILIVGESTKISPKEPNYDNLQGLKFTEYQPDGSISGRFTILWYEVEGDYTFHKGTWTNPTTGKSLPMTKPAPYPVQPQARRMDLQIPVGRQGRRLVP